MPQTDVNCAKETSTTSPTPLDAQKESAEDKVFLITMPIPPSMNHCYVRRSKVYYKGGKRKRRLMNVLSKTAAAWMESARDAALKALSECDWTPVNDRKVVVEYVVYWPDKRKRDAHNLSKLLCDSLEGTVATDDRYFLLRVMDYHYDKSHPRVEVKAYLYEEADQ